MNKRSSALVFFGSLYAIPLASIVLIKRFELPSFSLEQYGIYFMALVALASLAAYLRGHSLKDLGFRTDTLSDSLKWNGALSLALLALMAGLFIYNPIESFRTPHLPSWNSYYTTYILIYCPAQEFIYRSLAFAELKRTDITSPYATIPLTALSYAFAHILFLNGYTFVLTFAIGLAWGAIYRAKPNFWGVSLSHAVLGTLTIATGLL